MNDTLFIGLMSGTSLDAIDAGLVSFGENGAVTLQATLEYPFPSRLHAALNSMVTAPGESSIAAVGEADRQLGFVYAAAVAELLKLAGIGAQDVEAIGCHGQTVWHSADTDPAYTVQLGCGATLANETGIVTVNDFRSADIACGGQGAPLAPLFHNWLVQADPQFAFANLGGIANVTLAGPQLRGFDTGPANTLLDLWYRAHHHDDIAGVDKDGAWARSGSLLPDLLELLLDEPYLGRPAPKSTGRELFNNAWLQNKLQDYDSAPAAPDVQATLAEFTARTLASALLAEEGDIKHLYLCGGGTHNSFLTERIAAALPNVAVEPSTAAGVPPEWMEAAAFAWLASQRLAGRAAGQPSLTGARRKAVLGAVHLPAEA